MTKVFISHSWEDNEISKKMAEYLKRDGAKIWIDYARILGGDSLPEEMGKAIEWCDTMVLIWSSSAANSYYVKLEWTSAISNMKRIIPCKIDETKLPTILDGILYRDFKNFEDGYSKLVFDLNLSIRNKRQKSIQEQSIITSEFAHRPPKFRSNPSTTLSFEEGRKIVKSYNFFDELWNKEKGFKNSFVIKTINGNKLIEDTAAGLMWQQSGSFKPVDFEEAQQYVAESLNKRKYAGFFNWRLPSLEEAMSLMEPFQNNNTLYINELFHKKQSIIWTFDSDEKVQKRWIIFFEKGMCSLEDVEDNISEDEYKNVYVKAVRSV